MKTAKITLELNAIELNALLTGIESKWQGGKETRDLVGLASAVEAAAQEFVLQDLQAFEFETVSTVGIYAQLVRMMEQHFPEIKGACSSNWQADSEPQFRRAVGRARKQLAELGFTLPRRRRSRPQPPPRVPEQPVPGIDQAKPKTLNLELTREEVECLKLFLRDLLPDDVPGQPALDDWQSVVEVLARDYDPIKWSDITPPKQFGLMKLLKVFYRLCQFTAATGKDPFDGVSIGEGQRMFDSAWTAARDYFRIPRNRAPIKRD